MELGTDIKIERFVTLKMIDTTTKISRTVKAFREEIYGSKILNAYSNKPRKFMWQTVKRQFNSEVVINLLHPIALDGRE